LSHKVLYITYDGLLDQLGQSQILPYLYKLSEKNHHMHIVSFEKSIHTKAEIESLKSDLKSKSINWDFLRFTSNPKLKGKIWDLIKFFIKILTLVRKDNFKFIHARGHVPAMIAFFVHFFSSISYIFDFRGLWADERIDKGSWDTSKYSHNIQYRAMKFLERKLLEKAEHVVVLSEIVTSEIISISNKSHKNITVIPCCADYKHFNLNELTNTNEIKNNLGISLDSIVIGYIGSVGKMYRVDKLFEFFEICNLEHQNVEFLFITNDLKELSLLKDKYLGELSMSKFKSVSSHRKDVPKYLSIIDIGLSFIEPSYARQAASPTKLAEYFAMGIPVISSSGVGDTEKIIKLINGGDIINHDNKDELLEAAKNIDKYIQIDSLSIRNKSKKFFDLNQGVEKYHMIYKKMFSKYL